MRNPKLSPEAKCIYAYLSTFADKDGLCFPSVKTLTNELDIGHERLLKHMKQLQAFGVIEKIQTRSKGAFAPNVYRISHGAASPCTGSPHTENPNTGKPHTGKPCTENPHTNNTIFKHYQNTNNTNIFSSNNTKANNTNLHTVNGNSGDVDSLLSNNKDYSNKEAPSPETANAPRKKSQPFNHQRILDMYNKICTSSPHVKGISEGRRRELDKRKKDGYTMDDFQRLFELAQEGKHLTLHYPFPGNGKIPKIPTMDWLIQKTIMERMLADTPTQ